MRRTDDFMTVNQAREIIGVSKVKIAQWIKDGTLPSVESIFDKRVKLVRREDVERLAVQFRPSVGKMIPAA